MEKSETLFTRIELLIQPTDGGDFFAQEVVVPFRRVLLHLRHNMMADIQDHLSRAQPTQSNGKSGGKSRFSTNKVPDPSLEGDLNQTRGDLDQIAAARLNDNIYQCYLLSLTAPNRARLNYKVAQLSSTNEHSL